MFSNCISVKGLSRVLPYENETYYTHLNKPSRVQANHLMDTVAIEIPIQ